MRLLHNRHVFAFAERTKAVLMTLPDFLDEIRKFGDFAERVGEVYERYVGIADEVPRLYADSDNVEYEEGGEEPLYVMQEIADCESDLAAALIEYLDDLTAHEVAHDGATAMYDTTSSAYEVQIQTNGEHRDRWLRFCEGIKHRRRFFNDDAKRYLDDLMESVLNGSFSSSTIAPIRTIQPTKESNEYVYRGRLANSEAEITRILAHAARELGTPPLHARRVGRMNPAGIAAYYGCGEPETCVAELRVPVGGAAVVGKFEVLKPLRVLDLRAFDEGHMRLHYFDPDFEQEYDYVQFLRSFHDEIRKPVLPGDEETEYLPIQIRWSGFLQRADERPRREHRSFCVRGMRCTGCAT